MTETPRKYTRRSQEQWQSLITLWRQSGLSAINFCKDNNVSHASFYKWRQRLADSDNRSEKKPPLPSPDFIDITKLSTPNDQPAWNIVLNLGDGLSLTLSRN